jgi:hypothetical protein
MSFHSGSYLATRIISGSVTEYTASENTTGFYVECIGGGGGGGNAGALPSAGGGGGGGAYAAAFKDCTTPLHGAPLSGTQFVFTVAVGAAGAAGARGGVTLIATGSVVICAASGGAAGDTAAASIAAGGGAGGVGHSGSLQLTGAPGTAGLVVEYGKAQANTIRKGGFVVKAGLGGAAAQSVAGSAFGSGGSGGINSAGGATGVAGFIRITEYSSGSQA